MSQKRRQTKTRKGPAGVVASPTRAKRVTIKDLAEHLGLSPATISRALNGSPQADALSPATRQRVEAAARELDYRPNYLARSLRGKRSFSVGVLVPEISEGYTAGLMSGIERLLRDDGYRYLMVSHHSQTRLLDEALEILLDRGVEGFLLVAVWLHRRLPVPTVVVSGPHNSDGADRVLIDHDRAAALALDHLMELGHRRIAFFRGAPGNIDADDRWRAIREAARARDLPIDPRLVVRLQGGPLGDPFTLDGGYDEGYAAGRDLIERRQPFTALFAFNDISAIGATRAFEDAGLHIP
ncbi:MAG: LacI family DNA-binding transcriptional regulator, partial [Acidobacteriota bacterium]